MCGIFGVTADPDAANTILEGLKRLEYRGYDSWGIAVKNKSHFNLDKHVGKISVSRTSLPKSSFGIGHTRWATHGGVTQKNAHPHLDCTKKIVVVHNGIIDNWEALKKSLKVHTFISQTDSEIVAHLLEDKLKQTRDLFTAATDIFKRLEGFNALLVAHIDYPYIVAFKTGSPLVIGVNPGNHLISSDVSSLLPHTKKIIFLEDGQIAKISPDSISLYTFPKLSPLKPKITTIDWTVTAAQKGAFPHFMLKEIHEQPEILTRLSQSKQPETKHLAAAIKAAKGIFTVACGSAAHAAHEGEYIFSKVAHLHLNHAIGSEFYYYANFLNKNSLCIALSQSGETIDTLQSVAAALKQHAKTYALLNVKGSSLDRLSDHSLCLDVGPEKAVASTKAFLAKVALLYLTAYQFIHRPKLAQKQLSLAAKTISQVLSPRNSKLIKKVAIKIKSVPSLFVLGRGQSYPAALEIALKIKEISYIHTEGFPSGELKHGVIALIQRGTPTIVVAPLDETYADIISGAIEVKARGGLIIGISPRNNPVFDYHLPFSDCGDVSFFPAVVIGQLLAYHLAILRGFDPDMPRNLAKAVTVK